MCGLGIKVKRGLKNPSVAFNHTLDRIDNFAGKKIYGNSAGLKHNVFKSVDMSKKIDCFFCFIDARHSKGVIYVRAQNKLGRWDNVPICLSCFNEKRHLE